MYGPSASDDAEVQQDGLILSPEVRIAEILTDLSQGNEVPTGTGPQTILSFDVEPHDRIEAAANARIPTALRDHCDRRVVPATRWILEELERFGVRATFFIVGRAAQNHPELVRDIHRAGHEVASHSWEHRRIVEMTPDQFREDLRRSRDCLQQIIGEAVLGFRAPTFSVLPQTAWALDILAEEGFLYDSSIFPVYHDRYGVPDAPRIPFLARGQEHTILEIPPATLSLGSYRLPAGGGGYFRLFPLAVVGWALHQTHQCCRPPVGMLYFHPWEFDAEQQQLPLSGLSRFRTYVGLRHTRRRLTTLLARYNFSRAVDIARTLLALEEAHVVHPIFKPGPERRPDHRILPDPVVG